MAIALSCCLEGAHQQLAVTLPACVPNALWGRADGMERGHYASTVGMSGAELERFLNLAAESAGPNRCAGTQPRPMGSGQDVARLRYKNNILVYLLDP